MLTNRTVRRTILFVGTLLTIILIPVGTFFLGDVLEQNPLLFVAFWVACFLCAIVVLVVAYIDMKLIRKEHRKRQEQLDQELADIVEETRAMIEENQNEENA